MSLSSKRTPSRSSVKAASKAKTKWKGRKPAAKSPKNPAVSTANIKTYLELAARRRALESEARKIKREEAVYFEALFTFVRKATRGKLDRTVTKCGYEFTLREGGVYPAWKEAFIEALGDDAAAEVVASTPASITLDVEEA
jgi:hypothetical protein